MKDESEMVNHKIFIVLVIVLSLGAATGGVLFSIEREAKRSALVEFNNTQLQQAVTEQNKFIDQQRQIVEQQQHAAEQILQQSIVLQQKIDGINQYLASPEAVKQDKQSSEILKHVFSLLSEGK